MSYVAVTDVSDTKLGNCSTSGRVYSPASISNRTWKKLHNFRRPPYFSNLQIDFHKFLEIRDKDFQIEPKLFQFSSSGNNIINSAFS